MSTVFVRRSLDADLFIKSYTLRAKERSQAELNLLAIYTRTAQNNMSDL